MKLRYSIEMIDMGSDIIAVPLGEVNGVLRLNKEGMEILNLLEENVSETEIVERLYNKYSNDRGQLQEYVHKVIAVLERHDLLEG